MANQTIGFIVEYEDGTKASIRVGRVHMTEGDHFAKTVAVERQKDGTIPQGKIKSVIWDPRG